MISATTPTLVWCGRFGKDDGYGTAARSLLKAIRAAGIPYVALDTGKLGVFDASDEAAIVTEKHGELLTLRPVDNRTEYVVVVHDRPDRYPTVGVRGRARRIGYSYCEALSLPEGWITLMSAMDELWTSSEHNRTIFTDLGIPERMLQTVPIPIDIDRELNDVDRRSRWGKSTVFLTIISAMARRDLRVLYEAFAEAFTAKDDVVLALKVRPECAADVEAAITSVMLSNPARRSGTWPRVEIIESDLTREQMHRLQCEADVYVSTERGNGWCIPAFDSMALGRPVISFDWGGSSDFMDPDDCYIVPVNSHLVYGSDSVRVQNWMYDTNLWPTVDSVPLAAAFRQAALDPEDRRSRGRRAAERLQKTMDPETVGRQLIAMLSHYENSDFASNDPAAVEIVGAGSRWATSIVPSAEKLLEYRLIGLANDPAFHQPRSPKTWFRRYKQITRLAVAQHRRLPDGSLIKKPLDRLISTPTNRPFQKALAVREFRKAIARATAAVGGAGFPREIEHTMRDHANCVAGGSTEFSLDEASERRRKAWGPLGGVLPQKSDLARLEELRGRYHGERIFIMGNGPSLNEVDLDLLKEEYTFGANKIYMKFPDLDWQPTFYTLLDWRMGPAVAHDLEAIEGMTRFYPERFRGMLPVTDDTYWYHPRSVGEGIDDQFEPNAARGIPSRGTVLVTAIQLAFHLGFRDIVMIGVDARYTIPESVKQSGPDKFGTGTKLYLESTVDDDPNHFDQRYFGAGAKWHDPNVDDMKRLFAMMRKGVERHGGRLRNASPGTALNTVEAVSYTDLFP